MPPPPPPPPAPGGQPPPFKFYQCLAARISPGFFETMRIPLLRGRDFTPQDIVSGDLGVIVNQAFADRYLRAGDPIGRRVRMTPLDPWMPVIGVVGNIRRFAHDDAFRSELYMPFTRAGDQRLRMRRPPDAEAAIATSDDDQNAPARGPHVFGETLRTPTLLVVRTQVPSDEVTKSIAQSLASIDPSLPIARVATLQGTIDETVAVQRLLLRLFFTFGGTALLLAAIGVYGLTTYVVQRRRREMAVRVALGASPSSIEALVMRQGVTIAGAGIGVGLLLAFALSGYLREWLLNVSPFDRWAYAGVALGLAIVVLLACYLPARRAGRVDPVGALKQD
jgi:hypothetical protein